MKKKRRGRRRRGGGGGGERRRRKKEEEEETQQQMLVGRKNLCSLLTRVTACITPMESAWQFLKILKLML